MLRPRFVMRCEFDRENDNANDSQRFRSSSHLGIQNLVAKGFTYHGIAFAMNKCLLETSLRFLKKHGVSPHPQL